MDFSLDNDEEDNNDTSMMYDNNLDEDLNQIIEFDKSMTKYKDFYKEDVEIIAVKCIYINENNSIEKVKYENLILNNANIISCEEIIKILKSNNQNINKTYKIYSICFYNISIEPEDIKYIKEENFLKNIPHINDIKIEPTINILQDLNELILIFKEKNINNNKIIYNKSKKVYINCKKIKNKKTRKKL